MMIKLAVIVALMMTVASGGVSAGDNKGKTCLAEAMYYEARDQRWRRHTKPSEGFPISRRCL